MNTASEFFSAINAEIEFWELVIRGKHPNKEWSENLRQRAAGAQLAPPYLHKYLEKYPKILDVGSGPVSSLGGSFNDQPLDIVAVDPLAAIYNILLREAGINARIKPIFAPAEELPRYVKGKFDLVYSRNALDHSQNPFLAIQNMVDICKDAVLIEVKINEGETEGYKGLHQWNFMPANDDLLIWEKPGNGRLLSRTLKPGSYKTLSINKLNPAWLLAEIKK